MASSTLKEIMENPSLEKYGWKSVPILKELREQYRKNKTAVCIERARYLTEYMKNAEDSGEPMEIKRAKAINLYLSKREPLFPDGNLIAGSSTSKPLGAPVYPEFLGLAIWAELETISKRKANPQKLSKKDAKELNFDIFPYWIDRSILEVTRKEANEKVTKAIKLMEKIAFFLASKASVISHTVPNYEQVLNEGLDAMIEQAKQKEEALKSQPANKERDDKITFYQAIRFSMQGIMNYAENLSKKAAELADAETDAKKKSHYQEMADVCAKVPAKPSTTYREAINALWLCQVGILAENTNMALSPGRLDQVLYPFFKKDMENGALSIEDAITLTGCLWFKIADNTNLVPQAAEKLFGGAGSVPAVTLGGITEDEKDAVNELTYIMLRTTELLNIKDPNVNARYHYKINNTDYRNRVSEVIMNTAAVPAFFNDIQNIQTLENQGVLTTHARDYAVVGCVELASAGRGYSASSSIILYLNAALEMTLFNGKRPSITNETQFGPKTGNPVDFKDFETFRNAFETQTTSLIQHAIDLNEALGLMHQKYLQTPLLSTFFEGPMENGKDLIFGGATYNSSGATHIGFADVCDSLNAIEYAVFREKEMTMEEMINAVKTNFKKPYDKFLPYLKNKAPKYGTDCGSSNGDCIQTRNSQRMIKFLYEFYQSHTNYRNGKYRPSFWTMTNHAGQGKIAGALPNGRKAHEAFSSGITPTSQNTPELLPAFLSVAQLNKDADGKEHNYIPGCYPLNMKYTPETDPKKKKEYLDKFGDMIKSYFEDGGMQVQFTLQTYDTLLDAKKYPEKHQDLLVRVSGYSAFFNDLNEAMKDELITRSQYNLYTGEAVPFEEDDK